MSFKKSLFKNILISGGYTYLSQGVNFIGTIIVSRLLLPENYGIIGLITVFTGFIAVFSDGGLSYALIRSDYGRTYQKVLTNLSWLLGLALFLVTVLFAYPLTVFYHNKQIFLPTLALSVTFLLRSMSLAQGALLAKEFQFAFIGKVTLLATTIGVIFNILLAFLGAGYWSLVAPQIVIATITVICYERKVKFGFKIYPTSYIKVGFKKTKKLIGSVLGFNAVNYWARNSDNMIVGKWYGASSLGIYNRAYTLLTLPLTLITSLFSNILFPSLKKLKIDGGDIEKEYYFVLRTISFLSFPLVSIFILIPDRLVYFLWGKNWLPVADLLPYFGLLIFTQTLLSTVGQLLLLQEKEREYMISGWVGAFFLVASIVIGAFFSLIRIAQFYSFAFIAIVLSFNVIYLYVKTLNFNARSVILFWGSKILISILLWLAIYLNYLYMKIDLLALLFFYLLYDGRREVSKILRKSISEINKSVRS
ncbi:MAG: oligosaccharide flippase family protein [Mucilaginibacter sp.]